MIIILRFTVYIKATVNYNQHVLQIALNAIRSAFARHSHYIPFPSALSFALHVL